MCATDGNVSFHPCMQTVHDKNRIAKQGETTTACLGLASLRRSFVMTLYPALFAFKQIVSIPADCILLHVPSGCI